MKKAAIATSLSPKHVPPDSRFGGMGGWPSSGTAIQLGQGVERSVNVFIFVIMLTLWDA
jgi:hypothetical protein